MLDHCGNLADAASLSALAALLAFRRPDVTVDQGASGEEQTVSLCMQASKFVLAAYTVVC